MSRPPWACRVMVCVLFVLWPRPLRSKLVTRWDPSLRFEQNTPCVSGLANAMNFTQRCELIKRRPIFGYFSRRGQDCLVRALFQAAAKVPDLHSMTAEPYYVDIGANSALAISNSAFFDICFGWRGLCVEPNEDYHKQFKLTRSCAFAATPVTGERKWINFSMAQAGSHVIRADFNYQSTFVGSKRVRERHPDMFKATTQVEAWTVREVFAAAAVPRSIFFVDMDVEGQEMDILSKWPWDEYDVALFLLEIYSGPTALTRGIMEIMRSRGYLHLFRIGHDALLIKDAVWEKIKTQTWTEGKFRPPTCVGCMVQSRGTKGYMKGLCNSANVDEALEQDAFSAAACAQQ